MPNQFHFTILYRNSLIPQLSTPNAFPHTQPTPGEPRPRMLLCKKNLCNKFLFPKTMTFHNYYFASCYQFFLQQQLFLRAKIPPCIHLVFSVYPGKPIPTSPLAQPTPPIRLLKKKTYYIVTSTATLQRRPNSGRPL